MASAGAVPAGTGASAAVGGPCKHNSGGCRRITQRGGTAQALINGGHRLCHSRHRRRRTGVVWHLRSRAKPSTTSLGDTRARVHGMHTTELCPTRSTQTVDGKQNSSPGQLFPAFAGQATAQQAVPTAHPAGIQETHFIHRCGPSPSSNLHGLPPSEAPSTILTFEFTAPHISPPLPHSLSIVKAVGQLAETSLPNWRHWPPAGCRQRIGRLPGLRPPRPPRCNKGPPGKHTNRRYQHDLRLRGG